MKHLFGRYIYTEEEVALLRKVINTATSNKYKFKAWTLVKSIKQKEL